MWERHSRYNFYHLICISSLLLFLLVVKIFMIFSLFISFILLLCEQYRMIRKIKEMLYVIILLEALLFLLLFHSSRPTHMIEIMHRSFRGTRRLICFSAWELWVHSLLHLLQFKVLGFNFALICTFSSFISFLLTSLYHCDASWTRTRETSLIHLLPLIEGLELVNLITTDEK